MSTLSSAGGTGARARRESEEVTLGGHVQGSRSRLREAVSSKVVRHFWNIRSLLRAGCVGGAKSVPPAPPTARLGPRQNEARAGGRAGPHRARSRHSPWLWSPQGHPPGAGGQACGHGPPSVVSAGGWGGEASTVTCVCLLQSQEASARRLSPPPESPPCWHTQHRPADPLQCPPTSLLCPGWTAGPGKEVEPHRRVGSTSPGVARSQRGSWRQGPSPPGETAAALA